MQLPPDYQLIVDRLVAACHADERVRAAFLGGSYARGAADVYSDLDLCVITTDEAFDDFVARRAGFVQQLGDPLFVEDFGLPDIAFTIFASGADVELHFSCASRLRQLHCGPFKVLLDKQDLLLGVVFSEFASDQAKQIELLRRQLMWFWHDLEHFITAMGRQQLWWAYGQLEALRHFCLNLARLKTNILDLDAGDESTFKIENAVPMEQLSALRATFCPLEESALLRAGQDILQFYRALAPDLASTYDLPYPAQLERIMSERLEALGNKGSLYEQHV